MKFFQLKFLSKSSGNLTFKAFKLLVLFAKIGGKSLEKFELKNPFIILLGGATWPNVSVDVISGSLRKSKIPRLPLDQPTVYDCTMTNHFGTILVCGGNPNLSKQCYQLKGKTWIKHSNLIKRRLRASAITTKDATFLFGGGFGKTYEYLPKGHSVEIS